MTDNEMPETPYEDDNLTIAYMLGFERGKEGMIPRADAEKLLVALRKSGIDLSEQERVEAITDFEQKHGEK